MNLMNYSMRYKKSILVAFANKHDLQDSLPDFDRPRIQIFEINYEPNPTSSTADSQAMNGN